MNMAEPLIRMANIQKSYGHVQALLGANFHVNEKEIDDLPSDVRGDLPSDGRGRHRRGSRRP
jgi:hypothetical protein